MNDPMNELLKFALSQTDSLQKKACGNSTVDVGENPMLDEQKESVTEKGMQSAGSRLSETDRQRLETLNIAILSEVKEREKMGKYGTYGKKSAMAMVMTAVWILVFGSVSVIAAYRFLNPSQVALESDNKKLAKAFQGKEALLVNETQIFGDYEVTLLGSASGKNISDNIPADIIEDEIYAVLALKRTDSRPLPEFGSPEFGEVEFFPSFYIHGLDPDQYNLDGMSGHYTSCVKNGIYYYIVAMGNIEMFADKGIYVGLCVSGNDGDYNQDAYVFDKKTGTIARSKKFSGVNALFSLPIDESKADPDKAEKFIYEMEHKDLQQSQALTKEEKERQRTNDERRLLANKFFAYLTPKNINKLCKVVDKQICKPNANGTFTYSFRIGDNGVGYRREKIDHCFKDKTPGVLNIGGSVGLSGGADGIYRMSTINVEAYKMNKDGTITRLEYRPKTKTAKKLEERCKTNFAKRKAADCSSTSPQIMDGK